MATLTFMDIGACNCASCSVTFTVAGCNSITNNVDTLTISVYDSTDTTLLATGTTSSGVLALSWAGSTGTYHVHITGQHARFAAYNVSQTLTCGSPKQLNLSPATGYHCMDLCLYPLLDTLNFTTTLGSGTATFAGLGWSGSFSYAYPGQFVNCGFIIGTCNPKTITLSVLLNTTGVMSMSMITRPFGVNSCDCPDTTLGSVKTLAMNVVDSLVCPLSFAYTAHRTDACVTGCRDFIQVLLGNGTQTISETWTE